MRELEEERPFERKLEGPFECRRSRGGGWWREVVVPDGVGALPVKEERLWRSSLYLHEVGSARVAVAPRSMEKINVAGGAGQARRGAPKMIAWPPCA